MKSKANTSRRGKMCMKPCSKTPVVRLFIVEQFTIQRQTLPEEAQGAWSPLVRSISRLTSLIHIHMQQ